MDELSFKPLLLKLVNTPANFDANDVESAINHLAAPNGANPVQIGAFLTALKVSRLDRTPTVLSACANAMMKHSITVRVENPNDFYVDIVGTGGDGHDTFNVSTSAAIVAAGAGARVIKVILPIFAVAELSSLNLDVYSMGTKLLRRLLAQLIFSEHWAACSQHRRRTIMIYPPYLSRSFWRLIIILRWPLLPPIAKRFPFEHCSISSDRS